MVEKSRMGLPSLELTKKILKHWEALRNENLKESPTWSEKRPDTPYMDKAMIIRVYIPCRNYFDPSNWGVRSGDSWKTFLLSRKVPDQVESGQSSVLECAGEAIDLGDIGADEETGGSVCADDVSDSDINEEGGGGDGLNIGTYDIDGSARGRGASELEENKEQYGWWQY